MTILATSYGHRRTPPTTRFQRLISHIRFTKNKPSNFNKAKLCVNILIFAKLLQNSSPCVIGCTNDLKGVVVKFPICVACGSTDDLQHHHVVTRAEGGSNDAANLITLCHGCHLKLHTRQKNGAYNSGQLIREGFARARAAGVRLGRKRKLSDYQRAEAIKRRAAGETLASIAKSYGVDHSMISRLKARPTKPTGPTGPMGFNWTTTGPTGPTGPERRPT
jgi:5-methylcytosine-specific restriction endonuclease McrA